MGRNPRIKSVDNVLQIFMTGVGQDHLTVKWFKKLAQIPMPTKADMEDQEDYKKKFKHLNFKEFKFEKGGRTFNKIISLKEYKKTIGGARLFKSRTGDIENVNTKELIICAKKGKNGLIKWNLDKVNPFKTITSYTYVSDRMKISCRNEFEGISKVFIIDKYDKNHDK